VAVALVLASKAVRKATELFWRAECVQVIYNDVARVAVWNLHASLRFARLRVTVCDGNPVGLYWLPGDQTRTISNAEVVLSHSWRLSRCPACVLCSLRCIVHSLPHS
jgi:hypothetical protein